MVEHDDVDDRIRSNMPPIENYCVEPSSANSLLSQCSSYGPRREASNSLRTDSVVMGAARLSCPTASVFQNQRAHQCAKVKSKECSIDGRERRRVLKRERQFMLQV